MRVFLALFIVFSFSTTSYGKQVFITDGTFDNINQFSREIDARQYKRIFVGVTSGSIECHHDQVNPPIHKAIIASYFKTGSSWYIQNNCTFYCSNSAEQGSTISFEPLGDIVRVGTERQDYGQYVQCYGRIHYEIYGETK